MTVTLTSRHDLTLDTLRRVAWAGEDVAFSQEAFAHMAAARQRFMRLIEDPAVSVYGVTSGYGQNARVRLTPDQRTQHARRPPIQQAAGWGDPLPDRVTRGIIFARLANFIDGGAAISPAVAQAVAGMLDGR
ncbi:MAG: aromatic amino acid lyase, partial [Aestuariivirga sp.]